MSDVLNRTTRKYLRSVNEPDYPLADWIHEPDLSAVTGQPSKYWVITGDVVSLMDQSARDAVDAAETADREAADRAQNKQRFDEEKILKALALTTLDLYDLIKSRLRSVALDQPLPDITPAQMRDRIRDKADNL